MSKGDGGNSFSDWTDADLEADVEMFLKKGTRESNFDGPWDGEGGVDFDDAAELPLLSLEDESVEVSEPVRDREGGSDLGMSPKYCSESLTASSWGTPANAMTILSGR